MSRIATEQALARDIVEALTLIFGAAAVTAQGTNAAGFPTITYGSIAAGGGGAYIQVVPSNDASGTDSLGLTARVFHPHVIQAAAELSAVANVLVMTSQNLSRLIAILDKTGCKIELYTSANTVAPSVAAITGTPFVTIWPDLYNKMKQQQ